MPTRLYARFETQSAQYVYDAFSNQILRVTPEVWQSLDDYLARQAPDNHGSDGAAACAGTAAQQIEAGLASGFLAPCAVQAMRLYDEDAAVEERSIREVLARSIEHMTLELTEACNAQCGYCPHAHNPLRRARAASMSRDTIANALTLLMTHSQDVEDLSVSFWGGEPLVAFPSIRYAVEFVQSRWADRRIRFQFTTNATLFDANVIDFIVRHGFTVVVSLDGPGEIHDRHRILATGSGTFDRVMQGLWEIRERDAEYYRRAVRFHCVLTPDVDIKSLSRFFEQDDLLSGHEVTFQAVTVAPSSATHCPPLSAQDLRRNRQSMCDEIAEATGAVPTPLAKAALQSMRRIAARPRLPLGAVVAPNGCCVPLVKKMRVNVDGGIYLCESVGDAACLGNVNDGGIDVHATVELVREYCAQSLTACGSCWALRLCSACYGDFMRGNAWQERTREAACGAIRQQILGSLEDYASVLERNPRAFDNLLERGRTTVA